MKGCSIYFSKYIQSVPEQTVIKKDAKHRERLQRLKNKIDNFGNKETTKKSQRLGCREERAKCFQNIQLRQERCALF